MCYKLNRKRKLMKWNKSIYYMNDREIVQYYGQIWDNVKHMKDFVLNLRKTYQYEVDFIDKH